MTWKEECPKVIINNMNETETTAGARTLHVSLGKVPTGIVLSYYGYRANMIMLMRKLCRGTNILLNKDYKQSLKFFVQEKVGLHTITCNVGPVTKKYKYKWPDATMNYIVQHFGYRLKLS